MVNLCHSGFMGIRGLCSAVSQLKSSGKIFSANIGTVKGMRLGVDASSLIYFSARKNIREIVNIMGNGDIRGLANRMSTFIDQLMLSCSQMYLVFDGNRPSCICKAIKSIKKHIEQEEAYKAGFSEYIRGGYENDFKNTPARVKNNLRAGVNVSDQLVENLMNRLIQRYQNQPKFCCFQAPYDANQQLARMYYDNEIDAVLGNDSDMLVYNVPFFQFDVRAQNIEGTFYNQGALLALAQRDQEPLEDLLIRQILNNGCNFFPQLQDGTDQKTNCAEINDHSLTITGYQKQYGSPDRVVQTLLHALY